MELIVIASEFTNATGRGSTIREVKEIKKDEPPNQNRVHHVCRKAHKRGACLQVYSTQLSFQQGWVL